MNLTSHSRNRLLSTFAQWEVPKDYADPLYNYLVHGYNPGSFWSAVLANDFALAIRCSHPGNTIGALKAAAGWLGDSLPREPAKGIWGSPENVDRWLELSTTERRETLETLGLIYTGEQEVILILKDTPTVEPHLW